MRKLKVKGISLQNIIIALVAFIICAESVGYALFHEKLNINGSAKFNMDGIVYIDSITLKSVTNAMETTSPTYEGTNVSFSVKYDVDDHTDNYEITYHIKIVNDSSYDYVFTGDNVNASINVEDGSIVDLYLDGITFGDTINKKSTKEFDVTIALFPNTDNTSYDVTTDIDIKCEDENEDTGRLLAGVSFPADKTGDLTGNNEYAHFKVAVSNSYSYEKTFNIFTNSSLFKITDATGSALPSFTIPANKDEEYDIYVSLKPDPILPNTQERLTIMVNSTGDGDISAGNVKLLVDRNYVEDKIPPTISNVKAVQNSDDKSVTVTWDGTDNASVVSYTVLVYNNRNNLLGTYYTTADETFKDITLDEGTYYFKVYGIDSSGNTASSSDISNATTSSGSCSKSSNYTFKWNAKVSYDLDDLTSNGITSVKLGSKLTVTLTASGSDNAPSSITVTMGGKTLSSRTDYSYSRGSNNKVGTLTINSVTGDVTITASAASTCLVEGTKIKLANGKYKNIEDITYYDLLAVWDYDNGKITYEYPAWIENTNKTNHYTKVTFSDNTTLKFVGYHGLYNKDLEKFVSVDNVNEFYAGSNVLKVNDKTNKLETVKVTNIEDVIENVNYYHVVSTRYYNVLANNIITTDGTVMLSNLYGFDNNLKWLNKNNIKKYTYDDFKDIVPYSMYNSLRMYEAANLDIDIDSFKVYLLNNQLKDSMMKKPMNIYGKNIYIINFNGKTSYVLEGTEVTVPGSKDKYLSTLDNKIYKSGDKVEVYNSIYFENLS